MKPWNVIAGVDGVINIMFGEFYPMRDGKFPRQHPCADDPFPSVPGPYRYKLPGASNFCEVPGEQPESDTALGKLRAMGYWCSCFPEGDGMTVRPLHGQSAQQLASDASVCFARDVQVMRLS